MSLDHHGLLEPEQLEYDSEALEINQSIDESTYLKSNQSINQSKLKKLYTNQSTNQHVHDSDYFAEIDEEKTPHSHGNSILPPINQSTNQSMNKVDASIDPAINQQEDADVDDCLQIKSMIGLKWSLNREFAYYSVAVLTGFLSLLLSFWFPSFVYHYRYSQCEDYSQCDFVLICTKNGQFEFCPVEKIQKIAESEKEHAFGVYQGPIDQSMPHDTKMIVFRHTRYVFERKTNSWIRVKFLHGAPLSAINQRINHGLSDAEATKKLNWYGYNSIDINVPSIPSLLIVEVLHPFIVFQIAAIILWFFEAYFYFAGCIFIIATFSIASTLIETRRTLRSMSELARFECSINVKRDGRWSLINSKELVPGDLVEVQPGVLPCDLCIVKGACVVNESMLTGESLPIVKAAVDLNKADPNAYISLAHGSHTLFAATRIMQLKPSQAGEKVVAVVTRAGFATTKGALMLSILYPQPSSFKFVQQSYKFIGALACAAIVGCGISIWQLDRIDAAISTMIIRALDLITIVVPPSLPLALSVGTNYALLTLKKNKIFCISPARINMAGKVRLMCFDKTGTLTSEGMELKGVLPSSKANFKGFVEGIVENGPEPLYNGRPKEGANAHAIAVHDFSYEHDRTMSIHIDRTLLQAMACCHALAVLEGDLIGDPLEIQIFNGTRASLQDAGDLKGYQAIIDIPSTSSKSFEDKPVDRFGVKHQFEFLSSLQRMSTLCVDLSDQSVHCFVKGAPEMIEKLCNPASIPADYREQFTHYAKLGYRIIAIAHKTMISIPEAEKDRLRGIVESDLQLLGLIMLENKVKSETGPTLDILNGAKIRSVMVTGDFPVTAITVGKECGLISRGTQVYQSVLNKSTNTIEWVDSDDSSRTLHPHTLRRIGHDTRAGQREPYELAVSGDCYKVLEESEDAHSPESLFHRVILAGVIFARMTPDQKASLIAEYQSMGIYCGMCGDGANDCGALKTGNIGVSLSESEASIAAPFTYARPNIGCIPVLLSEGRSSLATSFSLFKYMGLYSTIQFSAVILTYFEGSVFGNWQYLYQDMIVVFLLTVLMGSTEANRNLSIKRPSGNLLSAVNVANVVTHMVICVGYQILVFLLTSEQSGYIKMDNPNNGPRTWEATSLYYFSNFQYIVLAMLFAMGHPWKKPIYTNWKFFGWLLVSLAFSIYLLFTTNPGNFFLRDDDVWITNDWRGIIACIAVASCFTSIVWELILCPWVTRRFKETKRSSSGGRMGTVFGRVKQIQGSNAKEWHRLRGEFERGW